MIGPPMTMMPGLNIWVMGALNHDGMDVDWSANRVSDEPACSNRAQNRTEKKIRVRATSMRLRSTPFSLNTT